MGRIQLLDDALVDQIAAGEVVERPSSVVKELLENAIDAESTTIRVEIREGGKERILIQDDGFGMSRQDAEMAVRRHATSKIQSLEDLMRVRTMGFRGEALASIASVSKFRLLTRSRDDIEGTEVRVEGGGDAAVRDAGCAPGTTIDVQELFYNVPVRRKFLRARQTETMKVGDVCLAAALAHPHLRLTLVHNGRTVREYLPARSRAERARAIFSDFELRVTKGERDGVRVEAALSDPAYARKTTRALQVLVNGRPVQDHGIARAVAFAFGDALAPRHYPVGVIHLDLPETEVDVNAHPQKTEVRFAAPRRVADAVSRVLAHGLRAAEPDDAVPERAPPAEGPMRRGDDFWSERLAGGPSSPGGQTRSGSDDRAYEGALQPSSDAIASDHDSPGSHLVAALRERGVPFEPVAPETAEVRAPTPADAAPAASAPAARPWTLLAQTSAGWLLVEDESALLVVDPVRARAALCAPTLGDSPPSRLVFPERVELDDAQADRLVERRDALTGLGLEVRSLGPRTVAIHSLPRALAGADAREVLVSALAAAIDALPRTLAAHATQPAEPLELLAELFEAFGRRKAPGLRRVATSDLAPT